MFIGTSFLLHPGVLPGGSYTHTCHVGKPIGYYMEVLVPLGPFCKKPLDLNLYGVTGEDGGDMTVSPRIWIYGRTRNWSRLGGYDSDGHSTPSSLVRSHRWPGTTSKCSKDIRRHDVDLCLDQEEGSRTTRRWSNHFQMSRCPSTQDNTFLEERQNTENKRYIVSPHLPLPSSSHSLRLQLLYESFPSIRKPYGRISPINP